MFAFANEECARMFIEANKDRIMNLKEQKNLIKRKKIK
jgi:hypothetical protein